MDTAHKKDSNSGVASEKERSFYITTPIYYPSNKLHIGNAYTTVAADAVARYQRELGKNVMFLTGMDEHGQKIQREAESRGLDPQVFVDEMAAGVEDLWSVLNISYDQFIRTTDEQHTRGVQYIMQRLYDQGDIYKDEYEGWYCTPCESFWTETQLVEGNCPDCGRSVEFTKEESYFFKLSNYQERLATHIKENPEFIVPESRANEMINNFLKPGLEDLAVSRTTFDWGIEVPFDKKHVTYVWVDALSNYITALGYPGDSELMQSFWPADVHLVGKDIIRFHTIIWPALLMALDLPLPKTIFGHGWLLFRNTKMSKSKGNVVDPITLSERYGVDAIRYFLLREVPFGMDGNFSNEALVERINSDLANDLGNLLSRTTAMIAKYFDGVLPEERVAGEPDKALLDKIAALHLEVERYMSHMEFSFALQAIWQVVGACNKYIDETEPWILGRSEDAHPRLASVLANLAEGLRVCAVMIRPFLPDTTEKILEALGLGDTSCRKTWESATSVEIFQTAEPIMASKPLFPRLDMEEEIEAMNKLLPGISESADEQVEEPAEEAIEEKVAMPLITYDDFTKMQLVTAKVLECEKVEDADRLLKFKLDLGDEQRTVVSGIAESYKPEELVGKSVVLLANLAPRKIRGIESQGMILSAENSDGSLIVLGFDRDVEAGMEIS